MKIPDSYLESLNAALAVRAEQVCAHLLKAGKRVGKTWQCGGVDGGPGKSMSVELDGEKVGVWHDRATSETGRLIKLWQLNCGMDFKTAVESAAKFVGMGPPDEEECRIDPTQFVSEAPPEHRDPDAPPAYKTTVVPVVDWERMVEEMTPEKMAELCEWRGYSPDLVRHIKAEKLIGVYRDSFAFPVTNAAGKIVAVHYKGPEGWRYFPQGAESSLLVLGSPVHAIHTLAFESQWDALAVLDKLEAWKPENAGIYAALVTRSATSNTDLSKYATQHLVACPQNDPREKNGKANVNQEGRTPAEEWLHRVSTSRNKISQFSVFELPEKHKDHNDWIRADNPDRHEVFRKTVEESKDPVLKDVFSTAEILAANVKDDPNALIGHQRRFLSRGGSWLIVGPSGIGKSTLITSLCINAAAGVSWHGLTFRRPLKVLVVQAENDRGDLAEMITGALKAAGFDKETEALAKSNIVWRQECARTGADFCAWLEKLVLATGADLVVLDPLLSYVGDDISQQKVASTFLRNGLQAIQLRTGCITLAVHHTGKPSRDPGAHKGWSESDFAYLGLGSSDITNWARAISIFTPHGVDTGVFRLLMAKRGKRAGVVDALSNEPATTIFLKHAGQGLGWVQCQRPDELEQPRNAGRKQRLTTADVLKALGPATHAMRRDVLIAELMLRHEVSSRTVKDRIDALILAGEIHVSEKTPRDGGGHDIDWLRAGRAPTGGNQSEISH